MKAVSPRLASRWPSPPPSPAAAQDDVAAFYKGKQMRLVVGSAVGGGYDLYSRALARHMVNHIPGNPTIIVQNQPAAGGMVLTNQLYNQGPKDGTVFVGAAQRHADGADADGRHAVRRHQAELARQPQPRSLRRVPLAHRAGVAHRRAWRQQGDAGRLDHASARP